MRSYALLLALAVLHARAATIPAPQNEKKLPITPGALDDVSLDNNDSEQELVKPADPVKDIENNLRNTIPENVPVKIIEEQPIIKTVPLTEDSNDYVPDNDDSSNIKRVEIDLKNPGPPQRQEHDSQQPVAYYSYIDKERAVAAIKQSIAESQNIFSRGIQDVTQKFKYYLATNDELNEVSKNIQSLKSNFDAEVVKLTNTINSYLKPEGTQNVETPSEVKEVENRLKNLETNFNYGVGMLSEGVELLTILKEEDDQNLKIAGKSDTENGATAPQTGTSTGTAPANAGSNPSNPTVSNPFFDYMQNLNHTIFTAFNNLGSTIQNMFNPSQTQNTNQVTNVTNQGGFNPANFFQGITIPNIFQPNQNTQQQAGTAPAGTQADDTGATERPNILQQIQTSFQNLVNPGQGTQQQSPPNPISQFFTGVNQGISNLLGRPPQTQPAAVAPAAQGTNSVPAAAPLVEPAKPAKEQEQAQSAPPQVQSAPAQVESAPAQVQSAPAPVQSAPAPVQSAPAPAPVETAPAQSGPIQQMVQNNPIVKGITDAVQRIQGLSNPSKPRDAAVENPDSKGHGDSHSGDSISGVDDVKNEPVKEKPEKSPEIQDGAAPSAESNKTE